MKHLHFIPILLVTAGISLRHIAYWCTDLEAECLAANFLSQIFGGVIFPIYFFSLFTLPVAITLCFVRKNIFMSWVKFAAWWLPLSLVLIGMTSEFNSSWMPILTFDRDDVTIVMASLFTIISFGLIAWKQFGSKNKAT